MTHAHIHVLTPCRLIFATESGNTAYYEFAWMTEHDFERFIRVFVHVPIGPLPDVDPEWPWCVEFVEYLEDWDPEFVAEGLPCGIDVRLTKCLTVCPDQSS